MTTKSENIKLTISQALHERLASHAKWARTSPATLIDRLLANAEAVRAKVQR